MVIAPESASWSPRRAEMCASDLFLPDMETFGNAVARGPMKPSTVEFEALWEATSRRPIRVRDTENQFVFRHRLADARVSWSSTTEPGVSFRTVDSGTPQETLYAAIGTDRNGAFFR